MGRHGRGPGLSERGGRARRRRLAARWIALAVVACLATATLPPPAGASTLLRLPIATGIAVDGSGNLYVTNDQTSTTALSRWTPGGTLLKAVSVGGLGVGNLGRLAFDQAGGGILWDLTSNGNLLAINPRTLTGLGGVSVHSLPIATNTVYDVASNRLTSFTGLIDTTTATYTDISALRRRADRLDLVVAGLSHGFPFVAKLTFNPISGDYVRGRVMISSRTPNTQYAYGRGVAVNTSGVIMTTLPVKPVSRQAIDRLVTLGIDYPNAGPKPVMGFGGADVTSRGIGVTPRGRFLVATGGIGTSLCRGSGAILVTTSAMSRSGSSCFTFASPVVYSVDAAASSSSIYATISSLGVVVKLT